MYVFLIQGERGVLFTLGVLSILFLLLVFFLPTQMISDRLTFPILLFLHLFYRHLESTLLHTFGYVSYPLSSSSLPFLVFAFHCTAPAVPASFPKENTPVRRL